MRPFSFVHAADLHLDSPFVGVTAQSPIVAEKLRAATFEAFGNVVDLCIRRRVDFLLVAGDVYDGADRSLRAQLRFHDELQRLTEMNIQSFVVHGNHDPLDGWSAAIEWPTGTRVFGKNVETICAGPPEAPIAEITGVSYPNQHETRNLARLIGQAAGERSAGGGFRIGLLHANVGKQPGHDPYSPCEVDDLVGMEVDYWALGHVHTRQTLHEEPHVVYPGNIQGRNVRETDSRGCVLVDIDERGGVSTEFTAVDVVRWHSRDLDINPFSALDSLDEGLSNVIEDLREESQNRALVCRVRLTGRGPLYAELSRDGCLPDLLDRVRERHLEETPFAWVEQIELVARLEIDLDQRRKSPDLTGEVLRVTEELRKGKLWEELAPALAPLYGNPRAKKALVELDEEALERLLSEAELFCVDRLESPS